MKKQLAEKYTFQGVAFSMPGFVDVNTGFLKTAGAIEDFAGLHFKDIMVEKLGLPVELDNDVIAEHFQQHNKIPAGFAANAEDMAPMAALLCSPLSRYIVGQNIVIDGGQHNSLF